MIIIFAVYANIAFNKTDVVLFASGKMHLFIIGIICFWFLLENNCNKNPMLFYIFIFAYICLQVVIVTKGYGAYGWDCGNVINSAIELAEGKNVTNYTYFAWFPNNAFLLLFYCMIFSVTKVFTSNYWLIAAIVNCMIADYSILLLYLKSKKYIVIGLVVQ